MILTKISAGLVCFAISGFAASASGRLSAADRSFMNSAADDNMIEAHLGQMAENQATRQDVKDFAKKLADDHSKAYGELLRIASDTGSRIPRGIDIRRDHAAEQLMRVKGAQFDRSFVRDEIADHEKALAQFRREAAHGSNPELKAWASRMMPVLQDHLKTARELAKSGANKMVAANKI